MIFLANNSGLFIPLLMFIPVLVAILFFIFRSDQGHLQITEIHETYKKHNKHLEESLGESKKTITQLEDRLAQLEKQADEERKNHALEREKFEKDSSARRKWLNVMKMGLSVVATCIIGLSASELTVKGIIWVVALTFIHGMVGSLSGEE